MRTGKLVPLLIISMLSFVAQPASASIGRIMTMSGDVKVNGQSMRKSHMVRAGDKITTGANSHVNIVMSDKSVLDIRANTRFQLEKFSYNRRKPNLGNSLMNLFRGSFRYISGLIGRTNHSRAQIRMGTATAGIRGSFATFGFDGKSVKVDVSLGKMTMSFADGSTMTVSKGQTGRSKANGEGKRVAKSSKQNPAMKAASDILKNPNPDAVKAAMKGMSAAEKAMVVAVMVANPTQLGASMEALIAAVKAVVQTEPRIAPLVAAVATAVAKDSATASALIDAVKEVEGVDGKAVDAAATEAKAITDDSATDDTTTDDTATDDTVVVDDTTISTTSSSSGGGGTSSP